MLVILLTAPAAVTATQAAPDYQRYVTFHNDFDFPIYPVIQVPADICDGAEIKTVRRILVNGSSQSGLQPNETLTVLLPNEMQNVTIDGEPKVRRCWYQSGRIYIFPVEITRFEAAMINLNSDNRDQTTQYNDPTHPKVSVPCFEGSRENPGANGRCFTGVAKNSFAADVPAQLAEYTFDSDNGLANGDPDTGIPMADIDVSFVDDLYLPIAASVENNGATGYMGVALDLATLKQRVNRFIQSPWPIYSAYLNQNQSEGNNALYGLFPPDLEESGTPAAHLPAGYNSIQNTLGQAFSSLYKTSNSENYLISGVLNQNTEVMPYVNRWMWWVNLKGQPCSTTVIDQLVWPDGITSTFDKQNFCDQFSATVNTVWNHFYNDSEDGFQPNQGEFYKDCGLSDADPNPDQTNACIIQHIVGYNSQVEGGELPGQVQALLRGVAYDPQDGIDQAGKKHEQYQFDPFLTFAAPYSSQFNLNPFTRLIHSPKDGIGAVAYSFSIDDKYGNFRDASLGFTVDAGGTTALKNQHPFDPYQQYKMNWGYNRDPFSLILIESGVDLASIQTQLQAIAQQNQNRPFLIKQDQNLSVLGHTADNSWSLTQPLVTESQLTILAQQEDSRTKGATHFYQDAIDHTFGSKSIFPANPLNLNAVNEQDIGLLDFDLDSNWPEGQALLYGFVSQQNADLPAKGNWVSATVCGVDISIAGPGAQRLPLQFANGLYQPCAIKLTDKFGETIAVSLTPALKQVTDSYTGATVSVWSLPIGPAFSGTPPTTSNLNANDLQDCQSNSSAAVSGLCNNITVSAVWADDLLARDVVYMGLDPKDMPRVNVNLPAAPPNPPDPDQVSWPPNATVTTQPQSDGTVLVSWPAAVVGSGKPLNYLLYVKDGSGWTPQSSCDQSKTSCSLKLGASASLYVIAVNNMVLPPSQTPQLFGCYPAVNPCPAVTTRNPGKNSL